MQQLKTIRFPKISSINCWKFFDRRREQQLFCLLFCLQFWFQQKRGEKKSRKNRIKRGGIYFISQLLRVRSRTRALYHARLKSARLQSQFIFCPLPFCNFRFVLWRFRDYAPLSAPLIRVINFFLGWQYYPKLIVRLVDWVLYALHSFFVWAMNCRLSRDDDKQQVALPAVERFLRFLDLAAPVHLIPERDKWYCQKYNREKYGRNVEQDSRLAPRRLIGQ